MREPVVLSQQQSADIDPDAFRTVMGALATGIAIVTGSDTAGEPGGPTDSACCSVTLDPPLLLVSIRCWSRSLASIRERGAFAVTILGSTQQHLGVRFASNHPDKFAGTAHRAGRCRAPLLNGALAHTECDVAEMVHAGDHVLVMGRVVDGLAREASPLLHFRRRHAGWPVSGHATEGAHAAQSEAAG